MSATIIFDSQDYARRLEQAGFTRQQAEAQAEVLKEHGEHLRAALQPLLSFYEETVHRDLATKGDVMDTRLEIERVRAEVEKVRAETEKVRADLKVDIESTRAEVEKVRADLKVEIEKVRADLKTDIEKIRAEAEKNKYDLLKWQIGIGLGLVAVMAKGFGWLGF
ncbi:DUF1640 domain-containing protein [Desulfovibrio piger]|nr:DUF1640 domain-containing protein [Desulfovibrio piger]